MSKARSKKTTEYKESLTRSVFLFGNPNKGKLALLNQMQKYYTSLVNDDIQQLVRHDELVLELVKNDKKASNVRALEKSIRPKGINSAFGQNAFDCAFTKLSNRLNAIRTDMHSENQTIFTQSKVLFAMSISENSKAEMISAMENLLSSAKRKDKIEFYQNCIENLNGISDDSFDFMQKEFMDSYISHSMSYSVPRVRREQVSLDSRLMKLEKSTDTVFPYVIAISNPFQANSRITVPLQGSQDGLRRLAQYKAAGTVHYSVWGAEQIRVQVSFNKKVHIPHPTALVGVDTGMTDCFYCSDGRSIGSMQPVINYYKEAVEPAFGRLSDLRNKKAKILHYLRKHPALPAAVRKQLLSKVDHLEWMIRTANTPYRHKRHYYAMLQKKVSDDVRQYLGSTDKNTLTVIERLDIKEFNKSRKANGRLSVFARGLLQKKLMEELNWHGRQFTEIEPDYSSQTCPVCGHIDADSRNGKKFHCTQCGHEDDADHNASLIIRSRAIDPEFLSICKKYKYNHKARQKAIRELGAKRSEQWLQLHMIKATA